jgi:hypothetical protein
MMAEYQELREIADRLGTQTAAAAAPVTVERRRSTRTRSARTVKATGTRASAKPAAAAKPAVPARPARRRGAASKSAAASKAKTGATSAAAVKAASDGKLPGKRDEDIIRLVAAQPGITVAQVGKELGVDSTGLYRVVRRLQASGHIRKQGVALQPAPTG